MVERDGPVTLVTINRPHVMNALDHAAHCELESIFDAFETDDEQWIAIITGAGERAFCAGGDLKAAASGGDISLPKSGFAGLTDRTTLTKPVIAAVNGMAFGGGFEVALACDIVVAAEHALFALPEVRVGLAALGGGAIRLSRQIPLKQAMDMLLTGRKVSAAEGLELGFVNEVVPGCDLRIAALRWAKDILKSSPMAVRATKQVVTASEGLSLKEALSAQWRYPAVAALEASQDYREGPLAFLEKRPPNWTSG